MLRLGDVTGGIPVGEVLYSLRKMPENTRVQLDAGRLGGPFGPEKVGGVGDKGYDPVRRDGEKLGEEIVFAAEIRHRRNSTETVVVARTSEAGRQPGRH